MQIGENNSSAKKTGAGSSFEKKNFMENHEKSGKAKDVIGETKETVKEAAERLQRAITKEQIILSGLEGIKENVRAFRDTGENRQFVDEAIDKTRFENERVLETFRLTLLQAVTKKDSSIIDTIIERVQGTIHCLYSELEKNEITKQNILSISSLAPQNNPEELIASVIESLKKADIPRFTIERERIIDLLSD
jgi:hypothetical protein